MKTTFLMLMAFGTATAFAQDNANCISVPISLTNDTKEVTIDKSPLVTTNDNVYVYYHRRKVKSYNPMKDFADIPDPNASKPVRVSCSSTQSPVTESYRVSVTSPESQVMACPDSTLSLTTDINVEKQSEFTGNYPSTNKNQFKRVSKHMYKKIARKTRHTMKKEDRVASLTGVRPSIKEMP